MHISKYRKITFDRKGKTVLMDKPKINNRAARRLNLKLPLVFQECDAEGANRWHAVTDNVSTGGAYFCTTLDDIRAGMQLAVTIDIDPTDLRFVENNQFATIAEVMRVEAPHEQGSCEDSQALPRYGLAVKFNQPLKLTF